MVTTKSNGNYDDDGVGGGGCNDRVGDGAVGGYNGEVDGGYDGVDGGCANKVSLFCRWQPRSWISNFLMSGVFAQNPSGFL